MEKPRFVVKQRGRCYYQSTFEATSSPVEITSPLGVCCYDPSLQECGAGIYLDDETVVTPVVTAKKSALGSDLKACGIVAILQSATCTKDFSCTVINYSSICFYGFACTNDLSKCPGVTTPECPGTNQSSCGDACYDDKNNFCFDHTIYSKSTHFKCGGSLYTVNSSRACCSDKLYNPTIEFCLRGGVYNSSTTGVCGAKPFNKDTQDCSFGRIVAEGNLYSLSCRQEYNPTTRSCQKGRPPFASNKMCNIGEKHALNRCYVPSSAGFGDACAADDQCAAGKCNGMKGLTRGQCVCQTDNDCGPNSICKKAGLNKCVDTEATTCPSSAWTYESRNPFNKDRCNRVVTSTSALQCKLGTLDKKKNWTGPHSQSGADECRSKKGKKPKGVKCKSGYTYRKKAGADTCTKTTTERESPTCRNGWKYESQKGRDICTKK